MLILVASLVLLVAYLADINYPTDFPIEYHCLCTVDSWMKNNLRLLDSITRIYLKEFLVSLFICYCTDVEQVKEVKHYV